jgi:hypothetical protein
VLRDSNQNIAVNRVNQANTNTTAAGGTTVLTTASSYIHSLVGTGNQTYTLPDATTLTTGVAFVFNNLATGTLTLANYAGTTIGTVPSGGAAAVFLTLNSTVGGTWDLHAYLPEGVTFGTNAFNLGTSIVSGGTWQGGTIATGYGGTGLTSYTSGGAVYANSSTTLTSGTLPVTAGGTGNTSGQAASTAYSATFNSGGSGDASGTTFNGSAARTISYNTVGAPSTTGTNASGTWGISISGNAATATSATNATNATNLTGGTLSSSGGTVTGGIGISGSYTTYSGQALTIGSDASYAYIQSWGSRTLWLNPQGNSIIAGTGASPILTSANYNSYAPTLTGGGASGTWGISITGSASGNVPSSGGTMTGNLAFTQPYGLSFANGQYIKDNGAGGLVIYSGAAINLTSGSSVSISGTNNGSTPVVPITVTGSGSFQRGVRMLNSGMGAGDSLMYAVGAADGSKNMGQFYFYYAGAASNSNRISMGLHSVDDVLNIFGTGNTSFGTTTDSGYKLNISGTGYASSDFRAPIFYDSNNTGYYADPAATSQFSTIQLNAGLGASADGATNDPYGFVSVTRSSAGNYSYYGLTRSGNFTASLGIDTSNNFWIGGTTSGYNATRTSVWFYMNGSGDTWSTSSSRAPIFYDSNNTAYYVDPASTSNLNSSTSNTVYSGYFCGLSGNGYGWYKGYDNNNHFITVRGAVSGTNTALTITGAHQTTFVEYLNPADTTTGWFFKDSYSGGALNYATVARISKTDSYFVGYVTGADSLRAPIFYDSNNTAYYVDPASTSTLQAISSVGVDQAYSARYDVAGATWSARIVSRNATTNVASFLGNYNGYAGVFGHSAALDAWAPLYINNFGGTGQANVWLGNMYAPIFYDSSNTAYYVDPASTSNLNSLVATVGTFTNDGSSRVLYLKGSGNIIQFCDADGTFRWENVGRNGTYYVYKGYGTGAGYKFQVNDDGSIIINNGSNTTVSGNLYAPIFYDSNDTAYYGDFASSSRLNEINLVSRITYTGSAGALAFNLATNDGYASMRVISNQTASGGNSDGMYIGYQNGNSGITRIFGGGASSGAMIKYATYAEEANSFRAPIFYDSNNTAYYFDPAGTSRQFSTFDIAADGSTGYVASRLYLRSHDNYRGAGVFMFGTGSSWFAGTPYTDFSGQYIISRIAAANDEAAANPAYKLFWVDSSGNASTTASMRSPIFYDSNDTTYYVNPASVSNLYSLTIGNYIQTQAYPGVIITGNPSYNYNFLNGSWTGSITAGYLANCADQWEMAIHDSGERVVSPLFFQGGPSNNYILMGRDIGWGTTFIQAASSFRAPIFYDSDNTSYYCDPNSQSSFVGLTVNSRSLNLGVYYQGFTLDANTMDTNSTGFTYAVNAPAVGPVTRFSTGGGYDMWLNAAYTGGNTLYFRTRNGDAGSINSWRALASYGINYGDSLYATILYDANDTSFYCDPNSTSRFSTLNVVNNITVSSGNTTGNGIILADDGDIVDLNDGYCSMRFSYGVRIFSANRGGSAQVALTYQGNVIAAGNVTAYGSPSDIRLKENVKPLTGALDKVMQLQGCTFDWKEDSEQHTMVGLREDIGFIADDVKDVVPNMVRMGQDGYLSLRDRGFSALLVEAMKEQQAQIAALRAEINALRAH